MPQNGNSLQRLAFTGVQIIKRDPMSSFTVGNVCSLSLDDTLNHGDFAAPQCRKHTSLILLLCFHHNTLKTAFES